MTEDHDDVATREEVADFLWRVGDLSWKLDSLQLAMNEQIKRNLDAKIVGILSSRQIGKSYAIVVLALEYCLRNPGRIARIIAPTLKQCVDIVNDNLAPICADAPPDLVKPSKSSYRWQVGRSSLRLGPLERAHVDSNRGGNASLVIYEECGFVSGDDFNYGVNSVLGPQLLRSNGVEVYVSSPSEQPDHPMHTEILPRCQQLDTAFRYTVYDSPSITPQMIESAIRRCGGETTDAFRREYLAEIIRPASSMIVPDFAESRHVKATARPEHARYIIVIDFGGTRDKTAGLLMTYDFKRNKILVLGERHSPPNTETGTIVAQLRELEGDTPVVRWADCAGQLQVDLNDSHEYQVRLPLKDDWAAAVNNMQLAFTRDEIEIDLSCRLLRATLASGQFNRTRTDFARSEALGHCDTLAALMYGIRMLDRTNPYPKTVLNRDVTFVRPEALPEIAEVAKAIQPVTIRNTFDSDRFKPKRFGSFKK